MSKPADKTIRYRDYEITHGLNRIWQRWDFAHKDYDGPEDGRCGGGKTIEDCIAAIDDRIDEGFDQ